MRRIRFAQFTSKAKVDLNARPDVELYRHTLFSKPQKYFSKTRFHAYTMAGQPNVVFMVWGLRFLGMVLFPSWAASVTRILIWIWD